MKNIFLASLAAVVLTACSPEAAPTNSAEPTTGGSVKKDEGKTQEK